MQALEDWLQYAKIIMHNLSYIDIVKQKNFCIKCYLNTNPYQFINYIYCPSDTITSENILKYCIIKYIKNLIFNNNNF